MLKMILQNFVFTYFYIRFSHIFQVVFKTLLRMGQVLYLCVDRELIPPFLLLTISLFTFAEKRCFAMSEVKAQQAQDSVKKKPF